MAGAFLGHAWTIDSSVHLTITNPLTDVTIAPVAYRGESFRAPLYYGYRIAWIPDAGRGLALEAEFIHMKVFARTDRSARVQGVWRGVPVDRTLPVDSVFQRLAMSHGLNFILANLVIRRNVRPRLVATARIGAGPTVPHVETTYDGVSHDRYADGGIGAQAGGGVEAALTGRLVALAEYKFTWASPAIIVGSGEANVPARSHHAVGGLGWRF